MYQENQTPFEEDQPVLSPSAIGALDQAARWARVLAVIGYVGVGLMVLAGVIAMIAAIAVSGRQRYLYGNDFPPMLFGMLYWVMAVIYFFPIRYLHKFGTDVRTFTQRRNSVSLEGAFEALRQHYQYIGILTIVILSLYLFILLIVLAAGLSRF